MPFFVIAGRPECKNFVHVLYVARYLEKHLPDFKISVFQKAKDDWEKWLSEINDKNKWYHTKSPIIWKELMMRGGKPHLIGGISEFWEYCYDYYSLQSYLSKSDLEKLVQDNVEYFEREEANVSETFTKAKNICISGAMSPIMKILLPEICAIEKLSSLNIFLYDSDPNFYLSEDMDTLIEDAENMTSRITLVEALEKVLGYCELFIITDDNLSRKPEEDTKTWLARNVCYMNYLSDIINRYGKRNLRIILAHNGPVCLDASVLVDSCNTVRIANIVALTSDLGLLPLSVLSKTANINLNELSGPPVWGFVGIEDYIDVCYTVKKCDIYRPFERAVRSSFDSTLPMGTIKTELRYINYLVEDVDSLFTECARTKLQMVETLGRQPCYSKVRALISLLKIWYASSPTGDIISLGVSSNGTFGLPNGLVFSQPAVLVDNVWKPCVAYPVRQEVLDRIKSIAANAQELIDSFGLGPNATRDLYSITQI